MLVFGLFVVNIFAELIIISETECLQNILLAPYQRQQHWASWKAPDRVL